LKGSQYKQFAAVQATQVADPVIVEATNPVAHDKGVEPHTLATFVNP